MNVNQSEQLTLQFYQWEYRGRGYIHAPFCVNIEPPFVPFEYCIPPSKTVDDGRVPHVFKKIGNLLSLPKKEPKQQEFSIVPELFESEKVLSGLTITFHTPQEISQVLSLEFLNTLSYSREPISFEILGTFESISIQMVCSNDDKERIETYLKAYFPDISMKDLTSNNIHFNAEEMVAIADFGLSEEFMRPITMAQHFSLDPLISIIALCDNLRENETILFQTIFKGATAPWAKNMLFAVSDGAGGSFFSDSPEMPDCADNKVKSPLFSVVMRIATQGVTDSRTQYLGRELARSISSISASPYNKLIPLSNEGYEYEQHLHNVYNRTSNRLGMILSSEELVSFVHYPDKSIVSTKLSATTGKTKLPPEVCRNQSYEIGLNIHNGEEFPVTLNDQQLLRHSHILGATGVGKSTLIANMILTHAELGNGCALFDPHGDICHDILERIPENRKHDVIIINPGDAKFPIGFNLLGAESEAEKIVLSSDLVSAFKRQATAWGDNIQAVLSNAINTFLESTTGGTLIELKRFLIEDSFRNTFLESVEDSSIHYYWEHEYPMIKKRIAPLLTRIDAFLRPKIIRLMLAQKDGIDFRTCIEEKKIILFQLSQGFIGEENSFLLGSLFLSKLNQVALSRQQLSKSKRHPFHIFIDEAHNFITPSISQMLSGVRKYGISLSLSHQELGQIEDPKILNSIISNPFIRICFRLGDNDAKRLESGFSFFEYNDLQNLGIGEAIMRVGRSNFDFNIKTYPLIEVDEESENIKQFIIQNTRSQFAKPKDEIQKILDSLLPKKIKKNQVKEIQKINSVEIVKEEETIEKNIVRKELQEELREVEDDKIFETKKMTLEEQKQKYLDQVTKRKQSKRHRIIQNHIQELASKRGFKTSLEWATKNGGRIDVVIQKDNLHIAIEISVTNTADYELRNIIKCLKEGFEYIFMVSENESHLKNIQRKAVEIIPQEEQKRIHFLTPQIVSEILDGLIPQLRSQEKRISGYRVVTQFEDEQRSTSLSKKDEITNMIISSIRKEK